MMVQVKVYERQECKAVLFVGVSFQRLDVVFILYWRHKLHYYILTEMKNVFSNVLIN